MANFYEFFAGGGMVRAGLGKDWKCLFANDFDNKKSISYQRNWGANELVTCDVRSVSAEMLPNKANLVWGSFPCQDLSLAGAGAGLKGDRSGTFWPFWDIVKNLIDENRAPEIIAIENVIGTLHSHGGKDFTAICEAFHATGYRFGAIVVDASLFVPQSRPRLFIVGVRNDIVLPLEVSRQDASPVWHTKALLTAFQRLPASLHQNWIWWDMPTPPKRLVRFADLIEESPTSVEWYSREKTDQLLAMMSSTNIAKVKDAIKTSKEGTRVIGAIYKRTRRDENGFKVQRAEVRFDDVAGCLRTPSGGSSRQLILVIENGIIRSRLISSRETARLMGLPEDYVLPTNYNEAYHLTGDGVAVPVVRHISENIFERLLEHKKTKRMAA